MSKSTCRSRRPRTRTDKEGTAMAASKKVPGTYNADEKAKERAERAITIGEVTFHPRRKTMALLDDWNQVSPNAEDVEAKDRDPLENFRDVYKQVQVFLVNDDGER